MQLTLTITATDPLELTRVLKALTDVGMTAPVELVVRKDKEPVVEHGPPIETPPAPVAQAPRRGRPPKAASTGDIPAPEKPAPAEPAKLTVVPKEVEKKDVTILDVRRALTEYLAANDETKAAQLLAKHGKTDRLSKLQPEFFESVYYAAVTPAVKDEFNDDIPDLAAK
jgi:hypothetical protein